MSETLENLEPLDLDTALGMAMRLFAASQFTAETRIEFYRQLRKLLSNGMRLMEAIELLYKRSARKSRYNPEAIVLGDIYLKVSGGSDGGKLSSALTDWAPSYERMLIAAGEDAGATARALELCVRVIEGSNKIKRVIRAGTIYPALLATALVGVLLGFSTFLVPQLTEVSDAKSWTGSAAWMRDLANFVENYIIIIVAMVLGGIGLSIATMSRLTGKIRIFLDRIPPWSIYRISRGATFLLSLAAFLEAGVKVADALERLSEDAPPWLAERIDLTINGIDSGMNLGEALDATGTGFPDPRIIDELIVYARLNSFDSELTRIGEEYLKEACDIVERLMTKLKTYMILAIFLVLVVLVSGVFELQRQIAQQVQMIR